MVKLSKVLTRKTEVSSSLRKNFAQEENSLDLGCVYKLIMHEGHIKDFSI